MSTGAKTAKKRSKSTVGSIIELVVIIAIALGLALGIQAFLVKPYRIPSGSMEPTLSIGQRVLVNRIGMDIGEPSVGEIAVFHPPEGAEQQECGPVPHTVKLGGAACDYPLPKVDRASTSSSGSSPVRAMKSTSTRGTSTARRRARARSSPSRTPTSVRAAAVPSANSRCRSRFPPGTGS